MTRKKEVVLIRHAKSQAQEASSGDRRTSFALVDAKLSKEGVLQMRKLGEKIKRDARFKSVQTVLCSPLSRALETACIIFEGHPCKIIVVPELAEFALRKKMSGYENTGRPYEDLCQDADLKQMSKFADVDFTLIKDYEANYGTQWWSSSFEPIKSDAQIARLKKIIHALPDERIVVVGHCCNMMKLLNTFRRVPNGVPIWCDLVKFGSSFTLRRRLRASSVRVSVDS